MKLEDNLYLKAISLKCFLNTIFPLRNFCSFFNHGCPLLSAEFLAFTSFVFSNQTSQSSDDNH